MLGRGTFTCINTCPYPCYSDTLCWKRITKGHGGWVYDMNGIVHRPYVIATVAVPTTTSLLQFVLELLVYDNVCSR